MEVYKCRKCGNLTTNVVRDLCGDCYNKMRKDINDIRLVLEKNPKIKASEVVAMGFDEKDLKLWLEEKRFFMQNDLVYDKTCIICDRKIDEGRYCGRCKRMIGRDMSVF